MTTRIISAYGLPTTNHANRDAALATILALHPNAATLDVDGEPGRTLVWDSTEDRDADTSGGANAFAEIVTTPDAIYRLAHRAAFDADWRDADAYLDDGSAECAEIVDINEAIAAADSLDETCGWDVIVVELDGGNKPRVVYS